MALFKILKGTAERLPSTLTEGYCWYTFDDSKFYIDYKDDNGVLKRQALNAKDAETITGASLSTILNSSDIEIPTSKAVLDALHDYVDNKTADDFGIYVQAQEPTDAVAGDIWIDTANDPSYIPPSLPDITESDNGKVLMVVNGKLQLVNLNLTVDANGVVSM